MKFESYDMMWCYFLPFLTIISWNIYPDFQNYDYFWHYDILPYISLHDSTIVIHCGHSEIFIIINNSMMSILKHVFSFISITPQG